MFLAQLKVALALLATSAGIVLASALVGSAYPQAHPRPDRPDPAPTVKEPTADAPGVAVLTLAKADLRRTATLVATVHAADSVDIYPKVSGTLKEQEVDIGDLVKKGQVLAVIDAPELLADSENRRAAAEQAQARLSGMEAAVRSAQAAVKIESARVEAGRAEVKTAEARVIYREKQLERIRGLVQRNAVEQRLADEAEDELNADREALAKAKAQVLTFEAGVAGAVAKVGEAEAEVGKAKTDLHAAKVAAQKAVFLEDKAQVFAPIDGVVTRRAFHVGDFVRSGDQAGASPMLTIVGTGKMRVVVDVPASDTPFLKKGMPATVRLDGFGASVIKGTVSRMAYALDPRTRTLRAEIDLDNADGRLRPGQSGSVALELDHGPILMIPHTALVEMQPGQEACYRVVDGRAVRTRVMLDIWPDDQSRFEVIDGLKEGDRVVAKPFEVKEGEVVEGGAGVKAGR